MTMENKQHVGSCHQGGFESLARFNPQALVDVVGGLLKRAGEAGSARTPVGSSQNEGTTKTGCILFVGPTAESLCPDRLWGWFGAAFIRYLGSCLPIYPTKRWLNTNMSLSFLRVPFQLGANVK